MKILGVSTLLLCFASCTSQVIKFDLGAKSAEGIWTAEGNNVTEMVSVPATVPGGIYSDLEAAGKLSSPIFYEYNDMESKWVGRINWTFSREFSVPSQLLAKDSVVLVCRGVDTVSKIFVNDVIVGSTKNMFVRYVFDIKSFLKEGSNKIKVAFMSPVEYAFKQYEKHVREHGYPVTPPTVVPAFRGENKAQMIRKMQSSFSWDWGPSYAGSGIWKDIFIQAYNNAVIRDVMIFTTPNAPIPNQVEWAFTSRVYLETGRKQESGTLRVRREGNEIGQAKIKLSSDTPDKFHDVTVIIPNAEIQLWWPNGMGSQQLYKHQIVYESDEGESSSREIRVGFRTIELIQDFVNVSEPKKGREFHFKVNGKKMFAKGSNSIPIHVLPEKVTRNKTSWLLNSAAKLHQNMIRVWGGGIYESDDYYDLADELGILIWEDFMFACAMYPATKEFLLNVRTEVYTQVKRLQHHASLAIWAANNENEGALVGNWYSTWGNYDTYKKDYIRLYVDTIVSNVTFLDPSRECLSSSPTNGIQTKIEGHVAQNPGDPKYGDIHHYDYFGDSWDSRTFRKKPRFSSEFGLQSFPYVGTLSKVAKNLDEWSWTSAMIDHRQRHPNGQAELTMAIRIHLPFPRNASSPKALPHILYMAQIVQSVGQKTQTEVYRRWVDKLTDEGDGHTMGALYWQLNDIWQGCSWASFEVQGRWKMLASYFQKAFTPILPSPYVKKNGDVVVELVSDALESFTGEMRIRVFKTNSMTPVIDNKVPVQATYLTSKEVYRIQFNELERIGCGTLLQGGPGNALDLKELTNYPCFVFVSIPHVSDNFIFLQYPKERNLIKNPNLRVNVSDKGFSNGVQTFSVNLETDEIALFVFMNYKGSSLGSFSENGFIMVEPQKSVTFESVVPLTLEKFQANLDIVNLFDVTSV